MGSFFKATLACCAVVAENLAEASSDPVRTRACTALTLTGVNVIISVPLPCSILTSFSKDPLKGHWLARYFGKMATKNTGTQIRQWNLSFPDKVDEITPTQKPPWDNSTIDTRVAAVKPRPTSRCFAVAPEMNVRVKI